MAGGTQARFDRWAPVVARAKTHASAKHLKALSRNIVRSLETASFEAAKLIKLEIGHEIDRWADKPTGKLERSFKIRRQDPRVVAGHRIFPSTIVSNSIYWRIHEVGGTITPKRSRYLTIPMTPLAKRLPARFWPRGVLFKPKGRLVLMSKNGRGKAQVQFVLRDSVRIHAKHYVKRALEAARPRIQPILDGALRKAQAMSNGQ